MKKSTTALVIFAFVTVFMVSQVKGEESEIAVQQLSISTLSKDRAHLVLRIEQFTVMKNFSLFFLFKWNETAGPVQTAVEWFKVPRIKDLNKNTTVFIVEMTLPILWNGQVFPSDNYTLTAYLGSNYDFDNGTSLLGWPSSDFPNFEYSFWRINYLGNYTDLVRELGMPLVGSSPSSIGNSWCKLAVVLRHTEDFSHYVSLMVNAVPIILYVLVISVFSLPIAMIFQCIMHWRRRDKRSNLIETIVIPIYVGIILFIPIFQLSIQPIKAPFPLIDQDSNLFCLFALSVVLLTSSAFTRFVIRLEEPHEANTRKDTASTASKPAKPRRRRDTELLKIQVYVDHCNSTFRSMASFIFACIVSLTITLMTLYLQKAMSAVVYTVAIILVFAFFAPWVVFTYISYHRCLDKVEKFIAMINKEEPLPSMKDMRKGKP